MFENRSCSTLMVGTDSMKFSILEIATNKWMHNAQVMSKAQKHFSYGFKVKRDEGKSTSF